LLLKGCILGVVVMFGVMEQTKCLQYFVFLMKEITRGHPVGEGMLISFCFGFIIEGAAGFGTPIALTGPIMVSLGHSPLNAIVGGLINNGMACTAGVLGVAIWFGYGTGVTDVNQDDDGPYGLAGVCGDLKQADCEQELSFRVAFMQDIPACFVVLLALRQFASWREIRQSWRFVLISTVRCKSTPYSIRCNNYPSNIPSVYKSTPYSTR
jgi:lactate permease